MQIFTAHAEDSSLQGGIVKIGQVMHSLLQFVIFLCFESRYLERVGADRWVHLSSLQHGLGEIQLRVSQVLTFLARRVPWR